MKKPWFCEGWNDMTYEEQQLLADKYEAEREDHELDLRERGQ